MKNIIPLSTNALMRHLRNDCNVEIGGSTRKKKLMRIGYYHGYKGYRFARTERSPLPIQSFDDIECLYLFDMELKALLYRPLMEIEMAVKNCALNSICEYLGSYRVPANLNNFCRCCFGDSSKRERYVEQAHLAGKIARVWGDHAVIGHFTDGAQEVPIWALFETLTLGEFVRIYASLSNQIKADIYEKLRVESLEAMNPGLGYEKGDLLKLLLYSITGLRNCIAHNGIILDARFAVKNVPKDPVKRFMGDTFKLQKIKFDDLTDCVLVSVLLMRMLGFSKTSCKQLVNDYSRVVSRYRSHGLRSELFDQVMGNAFDLKLKAAINFIALS